MKNKIFLGGMSDQLFQEGINEYELIIHENNNIELIFYTDRDIDFNEVQLEVNNESYVYPHKFKIPK